MTTSGSESPDNGLTVTEVTNGLRDLPGTDLLVAGPESGSPEMAWGDEFAYYDPDRSLPADRRMPYATIVTGDYPGFDESSRLDRPGVFRVNVAVGRRRFTELFGYGPAAAADHRDELDPAVFDRWFPHPLYAAQGWASILCPARARSDELRRVLEAAHSLAAGRHQRRSRGCGEIRGD